MCSIFEFYCSDSKNIFLKIIMLLKRKKIKWAFGSTHDSKLKKPDFYWKIIKLMSFIV